MAALPKMAAISISDSVSSLELNTGNLCVKIDSSIIPADQTSMAKGRYRISTLFLSSGHLLANITATRTDSLIRTFEQDFWRTEPPRTRAIRLDRRPLVILQEAHSALTEFASLPRIIHALLDRRRIIRLAPIALKRL